MEKIKSFVSDYHSLVIFLGTVANSATNSQTASNIVAMVLSGAYLGYSTYLNNNRLPDIRKENEAQMKEFHDNLANLQESFKNSILDRFHAIEKEQKDVRQQVQTTTGLKTSNLSNVRF